MTSGGTAAKRSEAADYRLHFGLAVSADDAVGVGQARLHRGDLQWYLIESIASVFGTEPIVDAIDLCVHRGAALPLWSAVALFDSAGITWDGRPDGLNNG